MAMGIFVCPFLYFVRDAGIRGVNTPRIRQQNKTLAANFYM